MRAFLMMATIFAGAEASAGQWKKLPALPDKEGFAGPFAGVSNGALLVAGGANFPDKKPWEGGTKFWYDTVFLLEKPTGQWKVVGKLPRPLAYGVSVSHRDGVVCVGGSDKDRYYGDAFRLVWNGGNLVTTKLPSLPMPLANSCGALVGDMLYIAGGQERPDSKDTVKAVWRIDLAAAVPLWEGIEAWPGSARMLSVAAGFDGAFWMVGGVDLYVGKDGKAVRRYLTDAYRYQPGKGWKRIADVPVAVTAAPSPAPTDATGFFILGGDDGLQVQTAPDKHQGFSKKVLRWDAKMQRWADAGAFNSAQATVPCVLWNGSWVMPNGEIRPGVRTPQVWSWTPGKKE